MISAGRIILFSLGVMLLVISFSAQALHRGKFVVIVDVTSTGSNLQLGYRCHDRTINPSQRILRNVG